MGQSPLAFVALSKAKAITPGAVDGQANLATAQGQGDYYTGALAGRQFFGASQGGVTLSAALATTYTGLCLSNPAASGKNLALQRVNGQVLVAPGATLALGLIVGFSAAGVVTHTTPITAFGNSLINGGNASIAKLDAACAIVGTPEWYRWLWANGASAGLGGFNTDIGGGLIIPPGGYVALGANVAGPTAGVVGSFEWTEI